MTDVLELNVRLVDVRGEDEDGFDEVTRSARDELVELDVESVRPLTVSEAPENAKGIGTVTGWLAVHLVSLNGLRALVDAMRDFAARNSRSVEITMDGDTLRVSGVTSAQQERLIADWLSRRHHGPSADAAES